MYEFILLEVKINILFLSLRGIMVLMVFTNLYLMNYFIGRCPSIKILKIGVLINKR